MPRSEGTRDHTSATARTLAARDFGEIVEAHGDLAIIVEAHQDGVCRNLDGAHDSPALWGIDRTADGRSTVAKTLIDRMLKRETTTEAPTETRDPARVDRQILILRHPQRDALLVGRKAGAAEHIAAQAVASRDARAIAWTQLAGLNPQA